MLFDIRAIGSRDKKRVINVKLIGEFGSKLVPVTNTECSNDM